MSKLKEELDQFTRNKKLRRSGVMSSKTITKISNEPMLNKYLEITMHRFTTKCSFLINQIREMESDFVSQLEGINALFSIKQSPSITNTQSKKPSKSLAKEIIPKTNETQPQLLTNIKIPSLTKGVKQQQNTPRVLYQNDNDRKLSLKIIQTNEESMKLKIDFKDKDNKKINVTKTTKMKDNVSNKVKALMVICNSDMLCFQEKAKIKRLNRQLHHDKPLKEVYILSKAFLEDQIKEKEAKKNIDLPSNTCQSNLHFIKKENENDLKDMTNKYNKAFFSLIYILFGERIPINISYEHLYESILRKTQAQSIKSLFLNVIIKKAVESPHDYSNTIIEQFNAVIDKHPELISSNALLNSNKSLFLFSFCLKELKHFFKYEKSKRTEIERLNTLLSYLTMGNKVMQHIN